MKTTSYGKAGSLVNFVALKYRSGDTFMFICDDDSVIQMVRRILDFAKNPDISNFTQNEAFIAIDALLGPELY